MVNMTLAEAIVALVDDFSIGDMIYAVRENADMTNHHGSSWDHPRVKLFSDAVTVLTDEAKRIKAEQP